MVMQNSSNSQKPKSSKHSRTDEDLEESKDEADESLENFGGGSNLKEIPTIVICQRENRQRGRPTRGRDEGRPPFRGLERRGSRGSRGGPFRSRNDRDSESTYSTRNKFQESSTRSSSYKHSNDSDVFKNRDGVSLLPEDCRISKLLRRLGQEDELEKFFAISKQLKEALLLADNGRYIRRSLEYILDSLLDLLHSGPSSDARNEGARCLGVAGIALEQDAKRLVDWVFATYHRERNDDVRVLLMKSLQHMLQGDAEDQKLGDVTHGLMTQLQHALESTDKPEILQATGNVILELNKSYPATFAKYFRDTVDILIGWHIDTSQPVSVTNYASHALQQLKSNWVTDLSFSLNLLSQFLEDMEAYSEDLVHPLSGRSSPEDEPAPSAQDCLLRITSIIQVFTTVTRSLSSDLTPCEGSPLNVTFLNESLNKVLATALIVLDHEECKENVLMAANECTCLLLEILGVRGSGDNLYELVKNELNKCHEFSYLSIISTLQLTSKSVRECSANLPEWLIHQLLGPESALLQLRNNPMCAIQKATLDVYHSLLSLKNIPLLQEAYRYVLQDLGRAYSLLVPEVEGLGEWTSDVQFEPYTKVQAEIVVIFLLDALSDLARAGSSIIGMWALKPTIMELLAITLLPEEDTLASLSPTLQYTLSYLLYSHCSRYNNFVSSNGLVITGRSTRPQLPGIPSSMSLDSSSPTSGHLTTILKLITIILTKPGIWLEIQVLGLRWATELILQAKTCLSGLITTSNFTDLVNAVIKAGSSVNLQIIIGVAACLKTLLALITNFSQQTELVHEVVQLCMVHINSPYAQIQEMYHQLLLLLPWHMTIHHMTIILTKKNPQSTSDKSPILRLPMTLNLDIVRKVNKIHCVRSDCGEMGSHHFRTFMAFLLQGSQQRDVEWITEMANSCLPAPFADMEDDVSWLRLAISGSQAAQLVWGAWQAAQFCVTFKLRTPLGKPQETFTSIEGAIKNLARTLNNESVNSPIQDPPDTDTSPTCELHRARLLLLFLEHLEKSIYNAAEGCAIAMPTQVKPVRLFFHTNKAVCGEWISRIRWATMLVATYCSMPNVVIRHGFSLLQDQLDQINTQGGEVEKAVVLVCNALVLLRETEALQGLYTWCKEKAGRRFPWVKAAALHAALRYEEAVVEYSKLLSVENAESQDTLVTSFLSDQMSECLRLLGNWNKLADWKEGHPELCNTPTLTTVSSSLSLSHVKALGDFDLLMNADTPVAKPDLCCGSAWRPSRLVSKTEEHLFSSILMIVNQQVTDNQTTDLLESCISHLHTLQKLMEEGVRGGPQSMCSEVLILQHVANALASRIADHDKQDSSFKHPFVVDGVQDDLGFASLNQVLLWSNILQKMDQSKKDTDQLQLIASRCARKEGNTIVARHLLASYWHNKTSSLQLQDSQIEKVLSNIDPVYWAKQGAGLALKETSKLMFSLDQQTEATNLLAQSALTCAQEAENGRGSDIASNLLLSLSKKLGSSTQTELINLMKTLSLSVDNLPLGRLLQWCTTVADTRKLADWDINIPDASDDACTQQLLQLSLISCPANAKAWSHFASWSYRQGRHASEWEEEIVGSTPVSDFDRQRVSEILGVASSDELCESIMSLMQEPRQVDETLYLRSILPPDIENSEEKEKQISILWSQRSQTHRYYHASAVAYFKFLQLCEGQENKEESSIPESILTATLRLLRLVVKHAHTLQDVLESGLALTPTTPWKGIIPQLFARLSHPESYVRRRLSELLCRLAADAPHLILFPAVVGCSSHKAPQKSENLFDTCMQDGEEFEDEEIDEEEDSTADESQTSVLRSCFLAMVDTLSQQAPASTSQVRLLVSELRRITVLWDELWLGCMIQHQPDINRRLVTLDTELTRLEENESLTESLRNDLAQEKYKIIMKPIIMIFEQLQSMTSVNPETPHERAFQEKFSDNITDALITLKNPPYDKPIKPQACWLPLRQFQTKLHTRAQRRTAHSLKLSDISPALANLKDSAIAMPGLSQSQPLVTIAALDNCVSVLPTKTRPKKLVLTGSDGKSYTYLFKGLEDLHLDERIMQFLSIANTMMARVRGAKFQARHYSVVPLGARSGLISWVDGVQPMFGLYKRWQLREANANQLRNQQLSTAPAPVPRPSELFYNKLAPLLTERGIAVDNRKEWPVQVLKQVLVSLINETPRDLLAKELWCMSANAEDWWTVTRTYSRSVAVMSVIGYIIGLGDRHLDNLLINLTTGEVVHIDYNVCFEKGQTLRVPEKVPFRMTTNLQTALGVTGCEGIFRVSCEQVLRVLKRGRETLLTLLEAFVYDPLIDWTPGSEAGYTGAAYGGQSQRGSSEPPRPTRRELEREAAQRMLAVRVTEMRFAWLNNRDELLSARCHVLEDLTRWITSVTAVHVKQEELQDALQQMSLLKEAAASGSSHPLFSLQVRHSAHERAQAAQLQATVALRNARDKAHLHNMRLQTAMGIIKGPELATWISELGTHISFDDGGRELFDLVREFLISAGQTSVMAQCEQSERESSRLLTQLQMGIRSGVELLGQYAIMVSLFSPQHLECIHNIHHEQLASELINNLTSDRCHMAMAQIQSLSQEPSLAVREQAAQYHTQLQLASSHANARLQAAYKRLSIEGPEDPTQRLEAALVQVKSQITGFASEPNSASALTVAALQQLCALNGGLLALEAAAASTGDSLVDLTLREGDWFLDKLLQMSGVASEIADTLVPITSSLAPASGQLNSALHCLKTAHSVYKGLEDLLWSMSSIIVPEAVTALTTQQSSVLLMVRGINELVAKAKRPLPDICKEIEMNLRYLALDLATPHESCQSLCIEIREGLQQLLHHNETSLSAGQMLLMGFNGLFERLQHDAGKLSLALFSLSTPAAWGRLDQLHKSKSLNWSIMKEGSQTVIEDLFLLHRLQVMQEFFSLCGQMALGFNGLASSEQASIVSEEILVQPVRRFTADFVRHQLIGLQPQTIALAVCVVMEEALQINLTEMVEQRGVGVEGRVNLEEVCRSVGLRLGADARLSQASALLGQLETTWRLREGAALAQREAEAARASAHRLQLRTTTHAWINDFSQCGRGVFIAEMRKAVSTLISLQPGLAEACEEQRTLVANITQRLKWAAGANPILSEVLMAFNVTCVSREERVQGFQVLSSKLLNVCSSILHLETLRNSTSESAVYNAPFMQLLSQCEQSAILVEAAGNLVLSPAEENLAHLLLPDQSVDMAWIISAENVVAGHVKQLGLMLSSLQSEQSTALEVVCAAVSELRTVLTRHHALVSGVRSLLRTLAKQGEVGQEDLAQYLMRYRNFSEQFSCVVRCLGCDQLEMSQAELVIEQLTSLEDLIKPIYENLLELPGKKEKADEKLTRSRPPLLRQDSVCMSPQHGVPTTKPLQTAEKVPQEKNAYALSVWRRVKAKLEGRDPDPNKKISVQEQVDFIINEATSLDNLCLLYEGWTPWV